MKFGELIKRQNPDLVVSPRHEAWMEKNANPVYSEAALHFGMKEMQKQATPRDRRGTVSASSLGKCLRRQQFTFLGMPERGYTAKGAQILLNGTFMHIRWQMAGLTEGWLARAEVPIGENHLRLTGTQDGIAHDGTVVEFKSINDFGFTSVANFGPKGEHLFQVGTYLCATDAEKASIVYENKNNQEYSEHIVHRDSEIETAVYARARALWDHLDNESLVEPMSKCIDQEGFDYTYCPFKDVCLKVKGWTHAKEIADGN